MLKELGDDEIRQARFQCVCGEGFGVSDKKATELAKYVARKAEQEMKRQIVDKLEVALAGGEAIAKVLAVRAFVKELKKEEN